MADSQDWMVLARAARGLWAWLGHPEYANVLVSAALGRPTLGCVSGQVGLESASGGRRIETNATCYLTLARHLNLGRYESTLLNNQRRPPSPPPTNEPTKQRLSPLPPHPACVRARMWALFRGELDEWGTRPDGIGGTGREKRNVYRRECRGVWVVCALLWQPYTGKHTYNTAPSLEFDHTHARLLFAIDLLVAVDVSTYSFDLYFLLFSKRNLSFRAGSARRACCYLRHPVSRSCEHSIAELTPGRNALVYPSRTCVAQETFQRRPSIFRTHLYQNTRLLTRYRGRLWSLFSGKALLLCPWSFSQHTLLQLGTMLGAGAS